MKIFHIWNTAGVASTLAKIQQEKGHQTHVVMQKKYDKFNLTNFGETVSYSGKRLLFKFIFIAKNYDILHVHACKWALKWLRLFYPRKKIIFHAHGSDVRLIGWKEYQRKYEKYVDVTIVATPDLMESAPDNVIYLPNPVDPAFYNMNRKRCNLGLAFEYYDNIDHIKKKCKEYNIEPFIIPRGINYSIMPEFLNNFKYFIDIKTDIKGNLLCADEDTFSLAGLQALACGCKVLRVNGLTEYLPKKHNAYHVVDELDNIYDELLGNM